MKRCRGTEAIHPSAVVLGPAIIALLVSCVPVPEGAVAANAQIPLWRSSWVAATHDAPSFGLRVEPHASGLELPTAISHAADGSERLFVAQQRGTIAVIEDGLVLPDTFLDIRQRTSCCGEQGLLGFAFDPAFVLNGRVYVMYTDASGHSVIARFQTDQDRRRVDHASETIVLRVMQPGPTHNGGALAFGPDGFLYASFGDGSFAIRPPPTARRSDTLLGKVIRIDVSELPYRTPEENPFVGDPDARGEIWALGLRNPWRMSFDRLTGELYIGDVGQSTFEEVNVVAPGVGGVDFGWPVMEGLACRTACQGPVGEEPIVTYGRDLGCAVTGGYVYRGAAIPHLRGTYVYGDFCSGRIWGGQRFDGAWEHALIFDVDASISAFGEDEAGELYFADYGLGELYRIVEGATAGD